MFHYLRVLSDGIPSASREVSLVDQVLVLVFDGLPPLQHLLTHPVELLVGQEAHVVLIVQVGGH